MATLRSPINTTAGVYAARILNFAFIAGVYRHNFSSNGAARLLEPLSQASPKPVRAHCAVRV